MFASPATRIERHRHACNRLDPQVVDALGEAVLPDDRPLITLAIGDPTAYEFISAPSVATEALIGAVASGAYNGYGASAVRLRLDSSETGPVRDAARHAVTESSRA